jgi:IS30 family transposase
MEKVERKNKHLTLDDRLAIQQGLTQGMTFKAIANEIGKDQTTISKEVRKRLSITPSTTSHFDAYGSPLTPPSCSRLLNAPFVCNSCPKRRVRCAYEKRLYLAKQAQQEYETLLSQAREGIPLNKADFYKMDDIISEGIRQGQRLYHISKTHGLGVSKSTIYRHLHRGYLSVSPIDFPRMVKFKPRSKQPEVYVPRALKIGRSYGDFIAHIDSNDISSWVEMDTVIGRVGGKVILTIHFTFCNFMAGFLLPDKTANSVRERFIALKKRLSDDGIRFGDIIPLILTDNGGEFNDIFTIMNDSKGEKETELFFCDPMQSHQKPHVEKNHTLFRDIVPKGQSFDHFTQETVTRVFSHVNSVKRKIFHGKSPYELFTFTYSDMIARLLGVFPVPAEEVIQSPALLSSLPK